MFHDLFAYTTSYFNMLLLASQLPDTLNLVDKLNEQKRRKYAAWSIAFVCIGVSILTSSASVAFFPV